MHRRFAWAAAVGLGIVGSSAVFVQSAAGATDPTAFEQYQLELINRARANPTAEVTRLSGKVWGDDPGGAFPSPQTPALNEGLPAGTISTAAKQPLAFNRNLVQAARDYSQTLIANSQFDHNYMSTPQSRMTAAGYVFSPNPSGSGENLAATGGSDSMSITTALAQAHHDNLFIDNNESGRGHRTNLMSASYREVGLGIATGTTTIFGSSFPTGITVQDFAYTAGNPFLTGVAYRDNVTADSLYTPGEGIGGATILAVPVGGGTVASTTTYGSGGYSLQLAPGNYIVTASGPFGVQNLGTVTIGAVNVKLDAVNPVPEPSGLLVVAAVGGAAALRRRRTAGR